MTKSIAMAQVEFQEEWKDLYLCAYEVAPAQDVDGKKIAGVEGGSMKLEGAVKDFFTKLFTRDLVKYPIPIAFISAEVTQHNEVREIIMTLAWGNPNQRRSAGKKLAIRLGLATPGQAKEGMFAVMTGRKDGKARVVLWRFTAGASIRFVPAGSKSEDADTGYELAIDPKTFTKQSQYFKATRFEDGQATTGFWRGHIKDQQVHLSKTDHARYWVEGFLKAQSSMSDERGSALLSRGVKESLKEIKDLENRDHLIQAAKLVQSQQNKQISLASFADQLNEPVKEVFLKNAGPASTHQSPFRLSKQIVSKQLGRKRLFVDEDIQVTAPVDIFDKRITLGEPDGEGRRDITIRGKITGEDLQPLG